MRPDLVQKAADIAVKTGTGPSSGEVFCYGKMPSAGDFVRYNAQGAGVRALDEWLQRAIHASRFGSSVRPGEPTALAKELWLVFGSRESGQIITGVLHPSRDRVGRNFPFIVGRTLEAGEVDRDRIAYLPAMFAPFLESAAALARAAAAGEIGPSVLSSRAAEIARPVSFRPAGGDVDRYLARATFKSLCERNWSDFEDGRKYKLFSNLLDVLVPLAGSVPASYPLGLRFPLAAGGEGAPEQIAFWMEICRRLLGGAEINPTLFWTPSAPGGHRSAGYALMFLRPPGAKAYAYLSNPEVDSDVICDLETMGQRSGAEAALAIPARIGGMLEDENITLSDFLRGLQHEPPYGR